MKRFNGADFQLAFQSN